MGKKRKIISKPQKFGRKHANHPLVKATPKSEEVVELKPEIKKPEPAPVTPVIKEAKPEPKKVEVEKEQPRKRKRKSPPISKKTKPTADKAI